MDERYLPVDVMRGAAIALMIMVNMPGSWAYVYPPLRHAGWEGCTAADLVFPFFLFITGYAMAFSLARPERTDRGKVDRRIARRVLVIFGLGILLNAFPFDAPLSGLRIMGVLQRIALAWGLAALLAVHAGRRALLPVSIGVLAAHWVLSSVLGGAEPWSLEGSLALRIDLAVLGPGHMWKGFGTAFEPEGILSTFTAAVSVTAGLIAGRPAAAGTPPRRLAALSGLWAVALAAAGAVLSVFQPVIKPLWTASYVFVTTGAALALIASLVWLIEVKGLRRWASFLQTFGLNALTAFVLSSLWARVLYRVLSWEEGGRTVSAWSRLYSSVFRPAFGAYGGSLAFSIAHIVMFWAVLRILRGRGLVIRA